MCMSVHELAIVHIWRRKFVGISSLPLPVDPGDQTLVIKPSSKHAYPLNNPTGSYLSR